MSTADELAVAIGIGGLIATVLLGMQNNRLASQQNEIFREQNRIFAAQAGITMPEQTYQKKNGFLWRPLLALGIALAVGSAIAWVQLSAPKSVGAIMVAVPWTISAILGYGVTYAWRILKQSARSAHELKTRIEQLRAETVSIAVNGKLVAGPAEFEEHRNLRAQATAILSPLQIEALEIAKELRDFLASLPTFPSDPVRNPGEENPEYLMRFQATRTEKQGQWRKKLFHGYANRKFGERITSLMHRAGEEKEYPAYVPNFAEKPPMSEDDVRKLAQQMEMMAIWINRKERNEVDLLHPKP